MNIRDVRRELRRRASKKRARDLAWFFKTGPGEYGEGDIFAGVAVPEIRRIAARFTDLGAADLRRLITSPVHEERMTAILILVRRFESGDDGERARVFRFYLRHISGVNNWDLVDVSCHRIIGAHLAGRNKDILYRMARSKNVWLRRIAVISTFHFIGNGKFADALAIGRLLLKDEHDLIHKATGWMLREIGNHDRATEERFLRAHGRAMPRTMLRYAIEKMPAKKRKFYLMR